jgi:hypothetical protein
MTAIAGNDAIKSFTEVESRFELVRSPNPDFFCEWQSDFDELTEFEKVTLDRIKHSCQWIIHSTFLPSTIQTPDLQLNLIPFPKN